MTERVVRGPYFDELEVGMTFGSAPAVTLTEGLAAAQQAVVGDRLPLSQSHELSRAVLGTDAPAAPAALVWNIAIGHSSEVTQLVRANLYYRGLVLRRLPVLGDTLRTTTHIVGLKGNRARPDRPRTGLATLRILTVDQLDRPVLDFHRCAMLPLRDEAAAERPEIAPDIQPEVRDRDLDALAADWAVPGDGSGWPAPGSIARVEARDLVSGAPELARLTYNLAAVHHDEVAAGGPRLVFGGHTIALALLQAARAYPDLLTVVAWHSCDHLAPVHEGDLLSSTVEVERVTPRRRGGVLVGLRSRVTRYDPTGPGVPVLDWRFVGVGR